MDRAKAIKRIYAIMYQLYNKDYAYKLIHSFLILQFCKESVKDLTDKELIETNEWVNKIEQLSN